MNISLILVVMSSARWKGERGGEPVATTGWAATVFNDCILHEAALDAL